MATISKAWVALAALLALLAVVGASTLTVFEGPGCTRNTEVYSCGCSNIKHHGGYSFTYTKGRAQLHDSADCDDSSPTVISDNSWHCTGFTYKSVFVSCPDSPLEPHSEEL